MSPEKKKKLILKNSNTNILQSMKDMLEKRIHQAPFLMEVDIPSELLLDDDVNMLHSQFDILQEQFKRIHRYLDIAKKKEKDSILLKENVQGLEVEKNHLSSKIQILKSNIQHVGDLGDILDAIQSMQDQSKQKFILAKQLQEQELAVDLIVNQNTIKPKLHNTQELSKSDTNSVMLQTMGQKCSLLRYLAKDKLPKEMETRQFHLHALQHVLLGSTDVDNGLLNVQAKLLKVNDEVQAFKKMRYKLHDNKSTIGCSWGSEVQRQQEQMTTIVANKICNALDRLAFQSKHRDLLIANLQHKLHSIEEMKGSVRRGEDLKLYVEALRGKSASYKAFKKELDDMNVENGELMRIQYLLEHQLVGVPYNNATNFSSVILPSNFDYKGITSTKLLQVIEHTQLMLAQQQEAQDSNERDSMQSKKVWQQISKLDMKLQNNQVEVGLVSQQLKEAKASLQELEVQHIEQQNKFAEMSLTYERKFADLEFNINLTCKEIEVNNKQLHESTLQVQDLKTISNELKCEVKDNAVSEELKTRIQLQEDHLSILYGKQKNLKDIEQTNKIQTNMMKDLLTFLAAKLALYSSELRPPIYSTNSTLENEEDSL